MWIVAPEVVQTYGDLKRAESAIGTGPFLLERYEPNVKTVFKRNPAYFLKDQPYVDGVEWLVLDDESTGLAMYRAGHLDAGPASGWGVRQPDVEALQSHPHLGHQDVRNNVTQMIYMRTDQPLFMTYTYVTPSRRRSTAGDGSRRSGTAASRPRRSPRVWPAAAAHPSTWRGSDILSGTIDWQPDAC